MPIKKRPNVGIVHKKNAQVKESNRLGLVML
jgi:hypothetical protein